MTNTRRVVFGLVLLAIENILLILIIFGTVWYLGTTVERRKSEFEEQLEVLGLGSGDFRARAPYVMFRPRPPRIAESYCVCPEKGGGILSGYTDFAGFCSKLYHAGTRQTPSPSRRIWELLSPGGRQAVKAAVEANDTSQAAQAKVSDHVNSLLQHPDLYQASDFQGVDLCEDAGSLLSLPRTDLFDFELARLNRHLLTAAYPDTLRPPDVVNSRGHLSPEISTKKAPNEFRVAMIGGSVVFCAPSTESTAVAELAKVLKQRVPWLKDKKVTFINAGLPSGVSGQELAQLIHHVLPLDIDLLVVYDGFNDFYLPLNGYDMRPGYPGDFIVEEFRYYKYHGGKTWSSTFLSLFDPTLTRARPEKVVHDYYKALQIRKPTFEEIKPKVVEKYMWNVRTMAKIANAYGIRVAVFLQPFSPKHNPVERLECRSLRQLYGWTAEQYKAEAKENGPTRMFHDLSPLGEELRELFVDVAHYKQDPGNAIVAKHMVDAMEKVGMLRDMKPASNSRSER